MAYAEIVNSSNNHLDDNVVPSEPSDDIGDITEISAVSLRGLETEISGNIPYQQDYEMNIGFQKHERLQVLVPQQHNDLD